MSTGFQAVQWNRNKLAYDAALLVGVGGYLYGFLYLLPEWFPSPHPVSWPILKMRAFGSCAFLMLTMILCIGPLARLDRRFLPLLYNRRHFGVLTCGVALLHAYAVLDWYDSHAVASPLIALFSNNPRLDSFTGFPFELLGVIALLVLLVMAATSHDFWLAFLSPPVWKAIHMLVYAAYALLAMHVALGAMQSEPSPLLPALLFGGVALVSVLHMTAASRERPLDLGAAAADWLDVGPPAAIADNTARIVVPKGGERIAVFRYGSRASALANVCAHQNGPLGEGRIVDGCVTCPWHGFQYRPEDGCAPPPFTEKVPTYRLRLREGVLQVDPRPLPPGTHVAPLDLEC